MLHAAVAERQLAAAAPAADQAGKQRITVLGRAMMPARGDVAGTLVRIASNLSQLT